MIGALARILVPAGQWQELLPFLFQCTQSTDPTLRQVALGLFESLAETIGDVLRPHFATMHQLLVQGLQDKDNGVRLASLRYHVQFPLDMYPEPLGPLSIC